jgi:hypothetical protein
VLQCTYACLLENFDPFACQTACMSNLSESCSNLIDAKRNDGSFIQLMFCINNAGCFEEAYITGCAKVACSTHHANVFAGNILCEADSQCVAEGQCMTSYCNAGRCEDTLLTSTPCSDGNGCTLDDQCQNGICVPGAPAVCGEDDECIISYCVSTSPDSYICETSKES